MHKRFSSNSKAIRSTHRTPPGTGGPFSFLDRERRRFPAQKDKGGCQLRAQVMLMSRQCPAGPVAGGPVFESQTTSPRVSPYMVWLCPAATVNDFVPLDVAIVNQHFGLVPTLQEKLAWQSRPGKFASAKAPVIGKHPNNSASERVTTYSLRLETACTISSPHD
jgi:hypothetical protein